MAIKVYADHSYQGGSKPTGLPTPSGSTDAATKGYVDALVVSGTNWKPAVRAATTVTGTLATAFANGQAIDGVTLATNDRILVKDQSSGAQNGIYVVAASGAPTRATDTDSAAELLQAAVFVEEGTTNADTAWVSTTNAPITVDSTAIVFAKFSDTGAAITGGAGLVRTANDMAVGAGSGITVAADSVAIDTSVVVRKYAVDVGDASSTSITVTHSLSTKDVIVQVFDNTTPFAEVICEVDHTSTSAVTLVFSTAPTSAQYRCVVQA